MGTYRSRKNFVTVIRDEDVTLAINGDRGRAAEASRGGRTTVSTETCRSGPSESGDDAPRIRRPDSMAVYDVESILAVHRHVHAVKEPGLGGGATVAAEPSRAGACDSGDRTARAKRSKLLRGESPEPNTLPVQPKSSVPCLPGRIRRRET